VMWACNDATGCNEVLAAKPEQYACVCVDMLIQVLLGKSGSGTQHPAHVEKDNSCPFAEETCHAGDNCSADTG
jgi:hypothetical protein